MNNMIVFHWRLLLFKKVIVCITIVLCTASFLFAEYPQEVQEKLFSCGYNSLYLFSHLKGYNVSFEKVKDSVKIGQNGTSFFDLQIGASYCNIKTQVVQCSYKTLQKLPLPVIAWINRTPSSNKEETVIGHFIVLISCTSDFVIYLDGTSGKQTSIPVSYFLLQWNGMVLMESKQSALFSKYSEYVGIFLFFIGLLCLMKVQGFKKQVTVCILIGLGFFVNGQQSYADTTETGIWRKPENESINAIYLLLRSHNLPCDYHTLEHDFKQLTENASLLVISEQSKKRGLSMNVLYSQSPEILQKIPVPYILHLSSENSEDDISWSGNYLLVIGRSSKSYMVLDCGTIQISEVSEELIRRYWSGYLFVKLSKQKIKNFLSPTFLSCAIGICVLLVYWGTRYRVKPTLFPLLLIPLLLFTWEVVYAETDLHHAVFSPEDIKIEILKSADKLQSLRVTYHSEYYTNPEAPPGTYLYRRILTKSPCFLNHTNAHPCHAFSWHDDPLLQQAFIQENIGYNIFPFRNNYFVVNHKPNDPLPGTLPGEFFFNATGIWPMEERKAPTWGEIPVSLRDVANNPNYNFIRSELEQVDGHWCYVLCWQDRNSLWLDMERGGILLARETYHPETGILMQRYELSNHLEAAPEIWIPKKLRNIQYDFAARTEEGQKRKVIDGYFDVKEIEVNTSY